VLNSRFKNHSTARQDNPLGQSMPVSVKQLIDFTRKANNSQRPSDFDKSEDFSKSIHEKQKSAILSTQ